MSMPDFNKILIDLESKINNSDEFTKILINLEDKVIGPSDDIRKLQDTTNRIERQILQNHSESTNNHNKAMQKINAICDKINLTQEPIFPNIRHSQQNNSADSGNSEYLDENDIDEADLNNCCDMNENQSGYMTIEDVNTIDEDEDVKIIDFDVEQEGKKLKA